MRLSKLKLKINNKTVHKLQSRIIATEYLNITIFFNFKVLIFLLIFLMWYLLQILNEIQMIIGALISKNLKTIDLGNTPIPLICLKI